MTLSSIDASKLRAGPSVGGTRKTVQVEVRRKRAPAAPQRGGTTALEPMVTEPVQTAAALAPSAPAGDDRLTAQERAARVRALQEGLARADAPAGGANVLADDSAKALTETSVETPVGAAAQEAAPRPEKPLDLVAARRASELAELQEIEAGEERRRSEENKKHTDAHAARRQGTEEALSDPAAAANKFGPTPTEMQNRRRREAEEMAPRRPAPRREALGRRQSGKMT
ncbi:MAG: translation initiation factor IF-2, partial [Candidatus Puniceispirillaceae bacterium]